MQSRRFSGHALGSPWTLTVTLVGVDRCGDPKNLQHLIWAGD
jgi:hypothetical protein